VGESLKAMQPEVKKREENLHTSVSVSLCLSGPTRQLGSKQGGLFRILGSRVGGPIARPAAERRTACLFLTGAALIVAAARLSYANIEPQRVLEAFIRRKLGSDHQQDPPPP